MAESVHGRFLWYELLTSDPAGAMDFYPMVTGWGGDVWHPTGGDPYHIWLNGDRAIGGLLPMPPSALAQGGSPQWLAHVGVDDVEAGIAAAEELGGIKLMGPANVESVGRFAVLADPEGAQFSIYRPVAEPPGQGNTEVPGSFAWNELVAEDGEAAFGFYRRLFGWEDAGSHDLGPMGTYRMFGLAGRPIGGVFTKPEDWEGPATWIFYVRVEDLERALEVVTLNGGVVLSGPMEVPDGDRVARFLDPQGAMCCLVQGPGS